MQNEKEKHVAKKVFIPLVCVKRHSHDATFNYLTFIKRILN